MKEFLSIISEIKEYLKYLSSIYPYYYKENVTTKLNNKEQLSKLNEIDSLALEIMNCKKCELSLNRKKPVIGEGNINSELMFIGEAPGSDEDEEGRPFVGKAGQLLTKIIESMQLKRDEVYITNIVKCHPPNNRPPTSKELSTCAYYLKRELNIIQPKIIVTLGQVSSSFLLETDIPISKLRGKVYVNGGIRIVPTFHPAHLLYHPEDKRPLWNDMKKVMKILEGLKRKSNEGV